MILHPNFRLLLTPALTDYLDLLTLLPLLLTLLFTVFCFVDVAYLVNFNFFGVEHHYDYRDL